MLIYGKDADIQKKCPACNADVGIYCGILDQNPAVHERRSVNMTENGISGLVGVNNPAPETLENEEKAPEQADSPLANTNGSAPTKTSTEPDTLETVKVVGEPNTIKQVDEIMDKLNSLMGDGIGTTQNCKVMIYGDPGTAKSSIAATAPNNLVFDFEDGLISAAKAPHGVAKNVRPMPYVNFVQAEALLGKLREKNPSLEWIEVFTVDTLTDFSQRTLSEIVERDWRNAPSQYNRYKPETEHYTENNEQMDRYVRGLKDLDRDLLILCHSTTVEPKNKPAKTYPAFSEKLATKLEAKMDVVGYITMQEIEGKLVPVMQTKSSGTDGVHCKSRIDIPDLMIDPTWEKIKEGWERTQARLREMQA